MKSRKIILLIIVWMSYIPLVSAEPMFIYFHQMITQAKYIVKGTYVGSNNEDPNMAMQYYFQADEILKGDVKPGKLTFNRATGAAYLQPGNEYMAFINNDNGFEWVGIDHSGKKIGPESLLFIEGFYDWNAYLVSPGVLTYAQLCDYIKTNSFAGTIYGDVHFFDMKEQTMKPSPIHIEVKYTFTNGVFNSESFINGIVLNDFAGNPAVGLPCWDDVVSIEFEPNLVRPLTFNGKLTSMHPSPYKLRAKFWVHEPEELSYDEFIQYVGNDANGPGYFDLKLSFQNKKTYTIRLNEETGRTGRILNYEGKDLNISSLSTAPEREIVFGYPYNLYKLKLDSCRVDKKEFDWAEDDLVFELKHGSIEGEWIDLKSNASMGACTLSYHKTGFTPNVNYGK